MSADSTSPQNAALDAIAALLQANGLSVEDLEHHLTDSSPHPTVAGYIETAVLPGLSKGERTVYGPYLGLLAHGYDSLCACSCANCLATFKGDSSWTPCACVTAGHCACTRRDLDGAIPAVRSCLDTFAGFGDTPVDQLSLGNLREAANWARQRAVKRSQVRSAKRAAKGRPVQAHPGDSAVEHLKNASSALYKIAIDDPGLAGVHRNLALELDQPRRPEPTKRSYTEDQLQELWEALYTGGSDDIELDVLIVWTQLEIGARRSGPINLVTGDLLWHSKDIRLSEKRTIASQPASPALILTLLDHTLRRGGDLVLSAPVGVDFQDVRPIDVFEGRARIRTDRPVLYYKPRRRTEIAPDGTEQTVVVPRPLTRKRFETLYGRLKATLPWLDEMHGRPHDLRKTAVTFIERAFGHAIAQRWLRHSVSDVTGLYVAAGPEEVRRAHAWWTGTQPDSETG